MMKKIVFFLTLFMYSMTIYANNIDNVDGDDEYYEVEVVEVEDDENDEDHFPNKSQGNPHVYYCNGKIQIASTYNIYNMVVVLRSQTGNVAYSVNIPVLYGFYSITLSPDVIDEAYSIELIYPSHHLIGYF